MRVLERREDCCGCGACEQVCARNAISMGKDRDGCLYPQIDSSRCVECHLCEKVCPVLGAASSTEDMKKIPSGYAAYCLDHKIRMESSSGGVFSVLAQWVLSRNGAVIGAEIDENLQIRHTVIENADDLWRLRGSKYVQSQIGDLYRQARHMLNNGRIVLFSGTPCEISGLYAFLGRPYDNLYTQDLICHGAVGPKLWEKYVHWQEEEWKSPVLQASFRNKIQGWTCYSMELKFQNKRKNYRKTLNEDPYLRLFLSNLYLRPSCYQCAFKTMNRKADITLGDFWNCDSQFPGLNDETGVSLVLVHSEKGRDLLNQCADQLFMQPVDTEKALKGNPAMVQSVKKPPEYSRFASCVDQDSIPELVRKFLPDESLKQRIRSRIPVKAILSVRKWRKGRKNASSR